MNVIETPSPDGYRIALERFAGPMDLLLHLVRKEEVDIHEISISRILEQYLAYLEVIRELDLDQAGDFLVMATTLMVIKSRTLLPTESVDLEEEIDPRYELVQQILEYKRFKDATEVLDHRGFLAARELGRPESARPEPLPMDERPLEELSVFDLLAAFAGVLESMGAHRGPRKVSPDDHPVREYVQRLRSRLEDRGSVLFSDLVTECRNRQQVIGNFLALLLLLKLEVVVCAQDGTRGDIRIIYRGDQGHDALTDAELEQFA